MDFLFVSGDPALDFAGTMQYRHADPAELLRTPDDFREWIVRAGLLDTPPCVDVQLLMRAIELREAIYRLAIATRDETTLAESDRAIVNDMARAPPVTMALSASGGILRSGDAEAVMATLARKAVILLGGDRARLIRECDASWCSRLYVDSSRRGSRRWCSMASCGNRAKVAAFRERQQGR